MASNHADTVNKCQLINISNTIKGGNNVISVNFILPDGLVLVSQKLLVSWDFLESCEGLCKDYNNPKTVKLYVWKRLFRERSTDSKY